MGEIGPRMECRHLFAQCEWTTVVGYFKPLLCGRDHMTSSDMILIVFTHEAVVYTKPIGVAVSER